MPLALAAYWFLSPRVNRAEFLLAALAALPLAYALTRLAGLLYSHEQPFAAGAFAPLIPHEIDNSFPSDHAALAGAMAGVAGFYNRSLGMLMWAVAVLVALGRMFAGLHYPVDIAAGLILGGLCAVASFYCVHSYFSARLHTN